MPDFPRSILEFQHQFPDEAACAAWLAAARWSDARFVPRRGPGGGAQRPCCAALRYQMIARSVVLRNALALPVHQAEVVLRRGVPRRLEIRRAQLDALVTW